LQLEVIGVMSRSVVSDLEAAPVSDQTLDQVPSQGSDEDPDPQNPHNLRHPNHPHLTEHPLVSAIVPAYNAQRTLSATLQSLVGQSYPHLEIIVTDDGSNDQTVQLVRQWMHNDSRIRLLQQANAGVGAARNLAIRHSRGSFIAPVDADDICYPEKIARLLDALQKAGDHTGLAYSWSAIIDSEDRIKGAAWRNEFEGPVYDYLFPSNFIGNASASLIRKSCFERVGLYNTHLFAMNAQGCEDFDMFLRISEHFEFKLVRAYLTGYRKAGSGMSTLHRKMERSKLLVYQDQKARHPWIPDIVFHWALAYYMLWLSRIAAENGCLSDALRYLVKAAYHDPKLLQNPDYIRMLPGHMRRCTRKKMGARALHGGFSIGDLENAHGRLGIKTSLGKLKEERRESAARVLRQARMEHGRFHPNAPSIGFGDPPGDPPVGPFGEQGARPASVLRRGSNRA
jgi:glycosyltransferase involved in cell wall biosynthesis